MDESGHSWHMKLIWVKVSMINAMLGKFNTFFLNSFFFFAIYVVSKEIMVVYLEDNNIAEPLPAIASFLPCLYVFLCFYLILASLNFKVDLIKSDTHIDKVRNTHTFFFISSLLGIYQVLIFAATIIFIIYQYIVPYFTTIDVTTADGIMFTSYFIEDGSPLEFFDNSYNRLVKYFIGKPK
jgi:hypothetical protein